MSFIETKGLYGFPSKAALSAPVQAMDAGLASTSAVLHVPAAASQADEVLRPTRPSPLSPETIAAEISASLPPPPRRCHAVVLFGAHGVGKGAVTEALCRKHGYAHVSFGW
jgi:hypothetical protein